MPITRMNHAVLYVRDATVTERFYPDVLGFETVIEHPDGAFVFMRAPASRQPPRHRVLQRSATRPQRGRQRTVGMYHIAWEVPTLDELEAMRERLPRGRRARRRQRPRREQEPVRPRPRRARVRGDVARAARALGRRRAPGDRRAARHRRRDRSTSPRWAWHEPAQSERPDRNGHTASFDPVTRRTVSAEIRQRLADAIHTGSSRPAHRCRPSGCCARSSASPAPRCARRSRGWSSPATSSGAATARWSPSSCPTSTSPATTARRSSRQLFEVRQVIEPAIAEMADHAGPPTRERAEIGRIAARTTRDLDEFREIDREFHAALARACGNPLLNEVHAKALAALFGSGEFASLLYAEVNRAEVDRDHRQLDRGPPGDRRRGGQGPHPQGGRRGGRPPRRRRAPDGGAAAVNATTARTCADQYCYFFDDERSTRPTVPGSAGGSSSATTSSCGSGGSRAAPRARSCTTTTPTSSSASSCAARSTSASANPTTRPARCCTPATSTSRRRRVWHGDSIFIGDDEYGEVWILDVFAPPRTANDRPTSRRSHHGVRHEYRHHARRRLAPGRRHRRHVHRRRAARRGVRPGRGRQDAHHAVGAARRRAHRRAPAAGQGRRPPGRHHRADRARHDADHQRADRGQDRPGRRRHHRGLRRHAADPQRAPLRHVRPADRVPGAAGAARSRRRDRRAHRTRRASSSRRRPPDGLRRDHRAAARRRRSKRSASA